ncbi:permease [Ferruginivarius sediminum]|uniref:Permease n=1 Tax=Ferruginivarius sediminum TaxID=2661937 RepID=A0A369T8R4_9PROT|nr:permease [Ferruginivarius sediminum]RDD61693.1 permease [Ferruginivarius sediminum]
MSVTTIQQVSAPFRRIDKAVLGIAGILAAIAAVSVPQAVDSVYFTLESLLGIAPFLLVAVGVAAYTDAAGVDRMIAQAFQGRAVLPMVALAALFGAMSPFCSCGVIPIIGALLAMGMPLPAVMAFWLASPVMDPEMFILTAGGIGTGFAVAKTFAAVGVGLFGGLAMMSLLRLGMFDNPLKGQVSCCGTSSVKGDKPVQWAFWRDEERRGRFGRTVWSNTLFLAKWLTLAFLLESVMLAYLPPEMVGQWVGGDSLFAIPLASVVGAPAYLNGYAAIPTTAALMELGMAPGAAMSFMLAGAVTSIPAAIAVYALVRRPVFFAYLAFGFIGALVSGVGYQVFTG